MTAEELDALIEARIRSIRDVLVAKNKEYANSEEVLHNFKRASNLTRETPSQCCVGFLVKHLVSILDMVDAAATNAPDVKQRLSLLEEKVGDAINYLILLEALLVETREDLAKRKR